MEHNAWFVIKFHEPFPVFEGFPDIGDFKKQDYGGAYHPPGFELWYRSDATNQAHSCAVIEQLNKNKWSFTLQQRIA